ncbi:MAG: VanZ family protein [Pyrinomonadaceae bacterium]|nr:VanZ family protein [Pyrinomonadaceae bacterium]
MARNEEREAAASNVGSRRASRAWRYGPLLAWMVFIFFASTAQLSASNTSRIIRPLLIWLFPGISEEKLAFAHLIVRKLAHLTEYAILGLLSARAFAGSSRHSLRRRWFLFSLLLVIVYALADEFHQSFIPERTGSVYDSFIDIAGGLIALLLLLLRRFHRRNICAIVSGRARP